MEFLRNTFHLFKEDWKRVFKSPMAIVVVLALIILPSFYAWFNIKALWDPYSNTKELPVAVYSGDVSANTDVLGKNIHIDIGKEVVDNLKKNHDIGWKFVNSKKELEDGVKSGKYYAGIYIPKNFSSNLLSIINGDIKRPSIDYYVNQKINAIAPKITDKGADAIQDTITKQFISTVSHTLFSTLNKLGVNLDDHIVDIEKVKNLILNTDQNLPTIEGYLNDIVTLNNKMPEIESKVNKVNNIVKEGTPKLNEDAQKVLELDKKMPELTEKLSPILTLQDKIPEIENAGRQVKMMDKDFSSVEQIMQSAIDDSKKGLEVLTKAEEVLPNVKNTINNANTLVNDTKSNVDKFKKALPQIANTTNVSLNLIKTITGDTNIAVNNLLEFINNNELTEKDKQDISKLAGNIAQNLNNLSNLCGNIMNILDKLQSAVGNQKLQPIIDRLQNIKNVSDDLKDHANQLSKDVLTMSTDDVKNILNNIKGLSNNINGLVNQIDVNAISSEINTIVKDLENTLDSSQNVLNKVGQIDVSGLLSNTKSTLSNALNLLEKYKKELPSIKQELHDANVLLNSNMGTIVNGINKAALFYTDGLPIIQKKLDTTAQFIQNDLPVIESRINNTMNMINQKLPVVKQALSTSTDLINQDWPLLKSGIQKAADQIRQGKNKVNLNELVKLLKGNINKETKFMTTPVKMQQHDFYPIPTYGAASTPFYTVLCLWVGGLLMASLLSTDTYIDKKDRKVKKAQKYNPDNNDIDIDNLYSRREKFVSRLLTFLVIGIFQTIIVVLGNIFILDVYIKQPVYSMIFALIVSISFVLCIYTMVGLFKDVGKAMAIIVLVLSVAGGGGNFPIQLSGKFFQMVNPLLPATYGYNLMREASGGVYWPNAAFDITMLVLFGVGAIIIGIFLSPYLEKIINKIMSGVKDTHFFNE